VRFADTVTQVYPDREANARTPERPSDQRGAVRRTGESTPARHGRPLMVKCRTAAGEDVSRWEAAMMKIVECGAVVPGCKFVAHGDSAEELMMKMMDHARSVHGIEHLSEPLKAKIRSAVKEDTAAVEGGGR
jgi:predicted small metal-binding protein